MSDAVVLRCAGAGDIQGIMAIEHACFGRPWPRAIFITELTRASSHLQVACDGVGEVLGFSCTWLVADEAQLLRIATLPRYQGRGIGGDLLSAVIARARLAGSAAVLLEVAQKNAAALRLYRRAGFEVTGVRVGYYRAPPDDAVLMRLALTGPSR